MMFPQFQDALNGAFFEDFLRRNSCFTSDPHFVI